MCNEKRTAIKIQITCKATKVQHNSKKNRQNRITLAHTHQSYITQTHTQRHTHIKHKCNKALAGIHFKLWPHVAYFSGPKSEAYCVCLWCTHPTHSHTHTHIHIQPPLAVSQNIIIFIIMTVVVTIKTITKTKVVSLHGN